MARFRLSSRAERDIEEILAWTHERFGEQARLRYEQLLVQAILDVPDDPRRAGSVERLELAPGAFTYHLANSRNRVNRSMGRVRKLRHFPLYRLAGDGCLEIGRVLHDNMDLARHLPKRYQADDVESQE